MDNGERTEGSLRVGARQGRCADGDVEQNLEAALEVVVAAGVRMPP
jgi:hypothetical protein